MSKMTSSDRRVVIAVVVFMALAVFGAYSWLLDSRKAAIDPYAGLRSQVTTTYLKGYDGSRADARRSGADPAYFPGRHPGGKAVVVNPRSRKLMTGVQSDLPKGIRAVRTGEVTVVVWMDRHRRTVGHYSGGAPAYQWFCSLTYARVGSGTVLGEEDVTGSSPPRYLTGQQGAGEGGVVTDKDIAKSINVWMTSAGG